MPANRFVPTLISELKARLSEVEKERVALTKALLALEASAPRRRSPPLRQRLVDALERSPGSRASFLALELGVEVRIVSAVLEELTRDGQVARAGMGWALTGPRSRSR
jgi:hypothetical protein